MEYLDSLNEVQRAAVTNTDGPMLVIAGPGSGKTRVLTFRIAYLIDSGVPPYKILALTFTNKAAREMKERIEHVVGEKARNVWAGTFHSIFARILRSESALIGFPSDFTIYDTDDSKSLIGAIIKEMGLDPKIYIANTIRNRISSAKSNLITPAAYAADSGLQSADHTAGMHQLHLIYSKYVARCQRSGAMDFDDLLYQMYRLLHQNPDHVLEKYRNRFSHLLVDEFQDTNYLQYAIIKKLCLYPESARNICAVGDDAQSIYAFRGATIDNILNFEKDFEGLKTFKLEQNYRSTHHIVQAANEVITHNQKQIKKEIWTDHEKGEKIKLIKAISDSEEAKRVADLIMEQKNRHHLENSEIAVLYRTNAQSRNFEEYFRRYNLPYRVYGGLSFYSRKEVKDLLAYLRLVSNSQNDEAFKRIINYPRRGIGNTSLDKLIALANSSNISLWEAACMVVKSKQKGGAGFEKFVSLISEVKEKAKHLNAYDVAVYAANKSGIIQELKQDNSAEGVSRLENLQALLDGIKEFIENDELSTESDLDDKSLSNYLQNIALITDMDDSEGQVDRITLMSVHAAKGLEYRSVFVVGMEENLFPSMMSLGQRDGLDEERRLFYVAITRAKSFLTLSYAKSRYRFGQIKYHEPSRFIQEISPERYDMPLREELNTASASRSGVGGFFQKKPLVLQKPGLYAETPGFTASPPSSIVVGVRVLHQRFGAGKVLKVDGQNDSKIATIRFENSFDEEKKIMLKFAKLQVLQEL